MAELLKNYASCNDLSIVKPFFEKEGSEYIRLKGLGKTTR